MAGNVGDEVREAVVVAHAFLRVHAQYIEALYEQLVYDPTSRVEDFRVNVPATFNDVSGGSFGAPLLGMSGGCSM